jgi:3-hydroxy-3-methylglutaryl CoA synthase
MRGIVAYGAYVPYYRLQRSAIGATLGSSGGNGTRAVAAYDEDPVSMGVEAARAAMAAAPDGIRSAGVLFSTTDPPYLDKTNATAIHAALAFDGADPAYDFLGSVRSASGTMSAAYFFPTPMLAVLADVRTGLPGGADERDGGDAAVAFLFAEGDPIAVGLGAAHATAEFLDRWRAPGDRASRVWEERFGEHAYVPLAEAAVADALKTVGLTAADLDRVIVTGAHARAARRVAAGLGARSEAYVDDLTGVIGYTGSAHAGLLLASVLDDAAADETIAIVDLADGCDVKVFRTTDRLLEYRARRATTVAEQIANGRDDLAYATFLTWRRLLDREPPRRPDPAAPAAPPSFRRDHWKYGFTGSRCEVCGTRHLPPARVCVKCGAVDQMAPERLADVPATIATYTIDRLAFSLNPPIVAAVVDFDGGGRFSCELTDVDPATVAIGNRVEMTFRRLFTANGVHNYFWKARPLRGGAA